MSRQKADNTLYTIQVTGEQIKTVRSLYMRIEMTWVHHHAAEYISETGKVERKMLHECHYCRQGSYENTGDIDHEKDCIIPLASKEFDALNAQFIEVQS